MTELTLPDWVADSELESAELLIAVGMLHAQAATLRKIRSRYPGSEYEHPPLRINYEDDGTGWVWSVQFMYAASGKQGRWSTSLNADLGSALRYARRVQLVHREALQ